MLAAGKFDRRVRIERAGKADDGYNETPAWAELITLWARYIPSAGREAREALGQNATLPATFIVRYSSVTATVKPTDRLYEVVNGVRVGPIFDIKSAVNPDRRESIHITALAQANT